MDTVNNKRRRTANEGTERETKIPKDDLKPSTTITKDEPSRPKRKQQAEKNKSKAKKSKFIKAGVTVERAKTAAKLAEALMKDPEKASALVLRMTLARKASKVAPNTWPPRNTVIPKSFVWANYPPLEAVLTEHEVDFYQLSIYETQTNQQLIFNNSLLRLVKETATEHGLEFDACMPDSVLRERIRKYFTTHTSNSKKRLQTMLGNPTKASNIKSLCELLEILEELNSDPNQSSDDHREEEDQKPAAAEQPSKIPKGDSAIPSHSALRTCHKACALITLCDAAFSL